MLFVLHVATSASSAQSINLDPPAEGTFVLDRANLLDADDEAHLNRLGERLLIDRNTPLIIVTINAMRDYAEYRDLRIETFAHLLFDQWGIGAPEWHGETWNTGILLVVSKNDRKARIQLGFGWRREADRDALRIMDREIIPRFKQGNFDAGIVAGAEALDALARSKPLPAEAARMAEGAPQAQPLRGGPHFGRDAAGDDEVDASTNARAPSDDASSHATSSPATSSESAPSPPIDYRTYSPDDPPGAGIGAALMPLLACGGVLLVVAIIGFAVWGMAKRGSGAGSGYIADSGDTYDRGISTRYSNSSGGSSAGGGFLTGLLLGGMLGNRGGSNSRSSSRSSSSRGSGFGGFSSGRSGGFSSGRSSGFSGGGGGFSGGGGASGSW